MWLAGHCQWMSSCVLLAVRPLLLYTHSYYCIKYIYVTCHILPNASVWCGNTRHVDRINRPIADEVDEPRTDAVGDQRLRMERLPLIRLGLGLIQSRCFWKFRWKPEWRCFDGDPTGQVWLNFTLTGLLLHPKRLTGFSGPTRRSAPFPGPSLQWWRNRPSMPS